MGDSVKSLDIETLRARLTESEARIEILKRQQAESKARAKAVIQKQRQQAAGKAQILQAENARQGQELEAVKGLLRDSDSEKNRLFEVNETLQFFVDQGKKEVRTLLLNQEKTDQVVQDVQAAFDAREAADAQVSKEKDELKGRIDALQSDLKIEREKIANGNPTSSEDGDSVMQPSTVGMREELERANAEVLQLKNTCGQLRKEKEVLSSDVQPETSECEDTSAERSQPVGAVYVEAREAKERVVELSCELERTKKDMKAKELEHEKSCKELISERSALEEKLSTSTGQGDKLRSSLEKSEKALQEEREKVLQASTNISESSSRDGGQQVLEAKIAEMERLVASKQADIVRVRDKAKSYLKDINAEKREMEEKMNQQVQGLRNQVEAEQENAKVAEQRVQSASSELDNCLALIREKQKAVQMLKMQVSSEKKAAEQAGRQTEILRTDFNAYKERARIALQEKADSPATSQVVVEEANLVRIELGKSRKEAQHLRRQLVTARDAASMVQTLTDRAEKAELVADVLKSNAAGASAVKYGKIDVLEEKMASLENDLMSARVAVEDAETRHETTKMRLEASERALHATEVRAEEDSRVFRKSIEGLRNKIADLEKALERSQESSAAAQRTAAAAAKALAFTVPQSGDSADRAFSNPRNVPQSNSQLYADERDSHSRGVSQYGGDGRNFNRSSFALAMQGHSDSLQLLSPRSAKTDVERNSETAAADIVAKEQQIAVLTSQLAELGALLEDAQNDTDLRSEQTALLKEEVKNLDAKLAAAEKLQNGAPFSYLRTIVVRYLETEDPTLLPVIANVLSFSDEESARIKTGPKSSSHASLSRGPSKSNYFSIPFLGSR